MLARNKLSAKRILLPLYEYLKSLFVWESDAYINNYNMYVFIRNRADSLHILRFASGRDRYA